MSWLKTNWLKILQFILKGFILYLCGALLYAWLAFNGGVGEKLINLIIVILLILVFTVDFHDDIIKFFKKYLWTK